VQGFVIFDHMERYEASVTMLAGWVRAGQLRYEEDILDAWNPAPMRWPGFIEARTRANG
jgi:NADPH-dependent curcumin reductase CurA